MLTSNPFYHNPFAWWDHATPSERMNKINIIIIQRIDNGFSFYDWINFSDYYITMIYEASSKIAQQGFGTKIVVKDSGVMVAREIVMLVREYNKIFEKFEWNDSYDDSYDDSLQQLTKIQQQLTVKQGKIVEKFLTELLPELRYKNEYIMPKEHRISLVGGGDYRYLGSYMVQVLKNALHKFANEANSYPNDISYEAWTTQLETISQSLDVSGRTHLTRDQVKFLVQHYDSLWD